MPIIVQAQRLRQMAVKGREELLSIEERTFALLLLGKVREALRAIEEALGILLDGAKGKEEPLGEPDIIPPLPSEARVKQARPRRRGKT